MKSYTLTLLLLLVVSCAQTTTPTPQQPTLKPLRGEPPTGTAVTFDGQIIAYKLYSNPGKPGIILLHMLGRTRQDYANLAPWLQQKGYAVITIDLRGHGQSSGDLATFTSADFNAMTNDVRAAKDVLTNNHADTKHLALLGASIGANIALNYAVQDVDVKTVILLSPGLDYKGVLTDNLRTETPLLIVASADDNYSAQSSNQVHMNNKNSELKLYTDAGHGTTMFKKQDLAPTIADWLQEHLS